MRRLWLGPGVLRLYLASLVVLQHTGIVRLGNMAVDIFFVMSGFWISSMWENKYRHCRAPYLTFLVSRFWRLAPVYFACLLIAGPVYFCLSKQAATMAACLHSPWWLLRTLAILTSASQPTFLVPAWSLDVELQFYLLAPLLLWLVAVAWKSRPAGAASLLALAGGSLLLLLATRGQWLDRYLVFFLCGILVYSFQWRPSPRFALVAAVAFAGLLAVMPFFPAGRNILNATGSHAIGGWLEYADLAFAALSTLLLLPSVAYLLFLPSPALDRHLGNLAYAVYLFHWIPWLAMDNIRRVRALDRPLWLLINWSLVAAGSVALYWFLDRPLDAWRRKFVEARELTRAPVDQCQQVRPQA